MTGGRRWASLGLAAGAVGAGAYAFEQVRTRGYGLGTWDVTLAWAFGIVCLLGLAAAGRDPGATPSRSRRPRPWRPTTAEAAGAWILVLAAAARLVALDRFPTAFDSDEGMFLTQAYAARHGLLPDPWRTGILTSVDGYYAVAGRLSIPFGQGIGAYRVLSATLGIVTVLAVWRLGRRVLGETAGLVAMAIVAFLPLHLWASRSALNNVSHAAVAGIVVGLGAYGYVGGTTFWVVALVVLAAVAVLPAFELGVRAAASIAGWLTLGAVVVAAPLLGHYVDDPGRFAGRVRQVDGVAPTVADRLGWVLEGARFPVLDRHGDRVDFYRVDGPFLGWIIGPLAVAGILVWSWWTIRRWRSARTGTPAPRYRCEPLLMAWLLLTVAVSQTESMSSQRWLALTPLWALSAAAALVALGRLLVARTALRPSLLAVAGAVLIGGVALASAARFFDEDQQLRAYGDRRTTGAYDLGWRMAAGDDDVRVLSLGAPLQPFTGFGNLRFQVPDWSARVQEVEPLVTPSQPGVAAPVLVDGQVAAIAFERIATDWCPVASANPDATFAEVRDRYGNVLYLLASAGPLRLATSPTPAGSTLDVVEVRC